MLTLLVFLACVLGFYLVLRLAFARRIYVQSRLDETLASGGRRGQKQKAAQGHPAGKEHVLLRVASRLGGRFFGRQEGGRIQQLQMKLQQAGSPLHLSPKEWLGLRLLAALFGCGAGAMLVAASGGKAAMLLVWAVFTLLGWIGPDFWLSRRVTARQLQVLRNLPNALDLLTVSVEAGLGFDQALERLSHKLEGPLAEEFGRCLREIQLGSSRAHALQRLAGRTGVDAVRTFVSSVVQSERLGVGMAQVLRVQAAEVRRKRRMDAQERAMKAPIKMLFPLVLFVFPALFIVVLGPAALHMISVFMHN